ncbi:MAG: hypothetical protein ACRD0Q_08325 [Acidimicrobiales bacterium]
MRAAGARLLVARAVVAVLVALSLGGCSSGDDRPTPPSGGQPAPAPARRFSVTSFDLFGPVASLPEAVEQTRVAVTSTLDAYLQRAVFQPLDTSGPAGDLAPVFTAAAATRLSGRDRAVLVDEGLAVDGGTAKLDSAVVAMHALSGADGRPSVVNANVDFKVLAGTSDLPVTIARRGDLVLVEEAGSWRIDSYDVVVGRSTPSGTTTSVAAN